MKKNTPTAIEMPLFKQSLLILTMSLLVHSLLRFFFFLYNQSSFHEAPPVDILAAHLWGIRYDISTLFLLNSPFLLLMFLPQKVISYIKIDIYRPLFALQMAVNSLSLFAQIYDTEYFRFTGQRVTPEIFTLGKDISDQWVQLAQNYWKLSLFAVAVCLLIVYLCKILIAQFKTTKFSLIGFCSAFAITAAGTVLGIRGGLQRKPLRPIHTNLVTSDANVAALMLNSVFTLIRNKKSHQISPLHFYDTQDEAAEVLKELRPVQSASPEAQPQTENVFIIIMESFALEYMKHPHNGTSYAPFFESFAEKGAYYENHFANGRRSIEAVHSIVASLPSLMNHAFVTSPYQSTPITGLSQILKKRGYSTWFFHGAKNGSMYFDISARSLQLDNYVGLNEYPYPEKDFDGSWGILDEPFFQFTHQRLKEIKQPFFATLFSLSSHNPYPVPEKYNDKVKRGSIPILASVNYADIALKNFFQSIENEDWYHNTLFVITADHTSDHFLSEYSSGLGLYRVPLILFHPKGKIAAGRRFEIAQHTDIVPTVLDYLGILEDNKEKITPFGQSLRNPHREGLALIHTNGIFHLITQSGKATYNRSQNSFHHSPLKPDLFRFNQDKPETPYTKSEKEALLKSTTQLYYNGLISRRFQTTEP